MGDGRFREGTPFVAGLKVDDANGVLVQELESRGRLLKHEPIRHSYPHCWRHKTPLISGRHRSGLSAWIRKTCASRQ